MKTKLLILGALFLWQCVSIQAQIPITTNMLPPSVGPYDQSYLPGPVNEATGAMTLNANGTNNASGDNDVLTYVAGDKASKGQSFTTGSNPMGYTINSITVRHILWDTNLPNGTYLNVPNGSALDFRFGTVSGTNANGTNITITAILTTNAAYSGSDLTMAGGNGTGIYFTFDLSGAGIGTLSPNTTYFFEIASAANPPYFELHNTRLNATSYTGGTAFYGDTTAQLDQSGVVNLPPYGGEFAFVAKLAAVGAPSVVAEANPSSVEAGQTFTITATVTQGVGSVTNVTVDLSAIGGSSAASLVLSNADVYTNTFTVPGAAPVGNTTLTVTAKDTTPLVGTYDTPFTVLSSDRFWTGDSLAGDNWSDSANWESNSAPFLAGSIIVFDGTTRLTPNMDANYSTVGMVFSNTAGSFNISSSTQNILTNGSGGIINYSANEQTLNVPIVLSAAQAFNAAAGNLIFNSNISGGAALTLPGAGTVTLAGAGSSAVGDLQVSGGLLKITNGTVTASATSGNTKIDAGGSVEVDTGATLNIANGGNAWFPVGDTSGTTNTLTVNGGTININDNWGIEVPRQGYATLNVNSGSMTVNDVGGVGLIIGDQGTAQAGTVNLNGGTLAVNRITANNGTSAFYFNGGTLKPVVAGAFFPNSAVLSAYVRDGGAIVDTAGLNATIGQPLLHSTNASDNAIDGGLIKIGNGTLTLSGGYGYTGPTVVLGGGLELNTALVPATGGDVLVSNALLTVDASTTPLPVNNLTLEGGAAITVNYGTLSGIPTNAAIVVSGSFSGSQTNVINITGSGFMVGQFPLVDSTGAPLTTNDFVLGSLPLGVGAFLTNNTGNSSLTLSVTAVADTLDFLGVGPDFTTVLPNWDINTSSNWYGANNDVVPYRQYNGNAFGDFVSFGDQDMGYYVDNTNVVYLPGRVVPAGVTLENTTYAFQLSGPGGIDGSAMLVVTNMLPFLLETSNNYTGGTFLNAGTLIITNDSALGAASGVLTMSGGTLEIAGDTAIERPVVFTTNSIVDTSPGVDAQLQLSPVSNNVPRLIVADQGSLTLAGTNTIGYLFDGGNLVIGNNGNFVISQTNGDSKIDNNGSLTIAVGGALSVKSGNNAWFPIGDTAGTTNMVTINGGAFTITNQWGVEVPRQGNTIITINSGSMTVNDNGGVGLIMGDQGTAQSGTINLNGGNLTVNRITASNGTNTLFLNGGVLQPTTGNGANFFPNSSSLNTYIRNGGAVVDTAGFNVSIAQPLLHSTVVGDNAADGGLIKNGDGTLRLNGVNTYTGPTIVNGGTLGGLGTIAGSLTVNANATFNPGNGGASDKITVNGNITLAPGSTNLFSVNGTTPTNTSVVVGSGVTYGGVLNIAASGTFAAGQQFQLFSGAGATNTSNFASLIAPGSGVTFSFTNGVLSVASVGPSGPAPIATAFTGGVLSLSWPAGQGWRLQIQTNSLSTGLGTNWVYLTDGTVSSTNITVDPSEPAVFYRLTYP